MLPSYDLHSSLGYRATLFARITERRFESALTPIGLTRLYWCVLLAVGQQSLKYPSEIAGYIGVDRTATSRALRQMERRGLIERHSGNQDRRTTNVSITPNGTEALRKATKAAQANASRFDSKLSVAERDTLMMLISKLLAEEERDVAGL